MLFRGRTVLAIMLATALATCLATIGALSIAGKTNGFFSPTATGAEAAGRSPEDASASGFSEAELAKLNKALNLIRRQYIDRVDADKLLDGAIAGMIGSLGDPYSAYYSEDEAEKFADSLNGAFTGIGAKLDLADGAIVVERVMKGTPAEKAGLQAGDILLEVNGQSLEGVEIRDAIAKIRGPKGTKAKLRVKRTGIAEPLELELVRDLIVAETVEGELGADGVGKLRIAQFTFDTLRLVQQELDALEKAGMKALVLDLRDNPGGVLSAAESVAEMFVPSGRTIVVEEDGEGRRQTKTAGGEPGRGKPYPIIVLVNGGSASSSEVLAGALKQSAQAVLVGSSTYGKGTVQVSFENELGDGSLLKLTVRKWLLPDGTSVQPSGIEPDVAVDQPDYFVAAALPRGRTLEPDETSGDVRNLQLMLEAAGCPPDRKDGYYSEGTRAAVEQFQQREKLAVTGTADDATATRLEEELYRALQDPKRDLQWQAAREKALLLAASQ